MSCRDDAKMEGCMVCGKELVYLRTNVDATCVFCKLKGHTNVECPEHHFVCDKCHSAPAYEGIKRISETTKETDPVAIAELMMKLPTVPMHGPEHHMITGAAVLTALKNQGRVTQEQVLEGIRRGKTIPGGMCGGMGACGAALGSGISFSVLNGVTPLTQGDKWKKGFEHTAKMIMEVGQYGGSRCCKRGTRLSMIATRKEFDLPGTMIPICDFFKRNKQCLFKKCPFFPKA